jgi:uncharacterized protein (DUF2147 family)
MKTVQFVMRAALALTAAMSFASAQAQMTPVGLWHTIDDKTGEVKGEIRIVEVGGVLTGKLERSLKKDSKSDDTCDKCTDERKDKPMVGLELIRGAKKVADKDVWEGGKILDPENGKEYTLRLTPIEGGKKLEVRGYIAFFFRNQTWVRVQ